MVDWGRAVSHRFQNALLCVSIVGFAGTSVDSAWGMAPAANVQASSNSNSGASVRQPLGDMIAARNKDTMARAKAAQKAGGFIAIAIGVATAAVCGAFDKKNSLKEQKLCTAAGIGAVFAASLLSDSIVKRLKEQDQKSVLVAASKSLRTGEPQALSLPDSSASASISSSGKPILKEAQVPIFYDTARMTELSKIQVIAEPYVITKRNTVIRNIPSTAGKITGKYGADQPFYVSGQVTGTPWYMVSERVVENENSAMMVVGYVEASQLRPAPNLEMPGKVPPATIKQGDVSAILKCDRLAFKVLDAKGKTSKGDSLLCLGPEGSPISA